MNTTTLKKTANYFRCVGILNEIKLTREPALISIKENGRQIKKVKGERIYGDFVVKTDNGVYDFNFYAQNLTQEGKESRNWKMYTEMEKWNPMIGGDTAKEPTLIDIGGSIEINDYFNVNTNNVHTSLRWRVNKVSSKVNPDAIKGISLKGTFFIKGIIKEIRDEQETGRLIVTLYGANYKGECFPITAYVNSEEANDFDNYYEIAQTVSFDFELVCRQIGEVKTKNKKFGRDTLVNINEGYSIKELIIVGGDEPIEAPEEVTTINENGEEIEIETKWINPAAMIKAIKIREQMLEELKNPSSKKKSSLEFKENLIKENLNNFKFGKKINIDIDDNDDDLF